MYEVSGLKLLFGTKLLEIINAENVLDILTLFDRYQAKDLKEAAIFFIYDNKDLIIKDNELWTKFKITNPELAAEISSKTRIRDSIMDIFEE